MLITIQVKYNQTRMTTLVDLLDDYMTVTLKNGYIRNWINNK
jgi:hypothetical protein